MEARRKEQERLKARYGYRYPEKEKLNAIDIHDAKISEQTLIEMSYMIDEKKAREKIHEIIPTITDNEIDEYRRAGGKE